MKRIYLIILVLFLSCNTACYVNRYSNFDLKILNKENLSKRKYFVNQKVLLQENELFLIGYNVRLTNGLVPKFVDGKLYKLVLKTKDSLYFFSDVEANNHTILKLLKGHLKNKEAINKVETYYEDYKKGYILLE